MSEVLQALGQAIYYGANAYIWVLILRVVLTWVNPNPYSPFMRALAKVTDPALNAARRHCPFRAGGLDFSPVLALFAVFLVGEVAGRGLFLMGHGAPATVFLALAAASAINLLTSVAWLLILLMLARVVMSLVNPAPYNPIVLAVYGLTEPLLAPLRKFFPRGPGGLDWKALVFVVALVLAWQLLTIAAGLFRVAPGV